MLHCGSYSMLTWLDPRQAVRPRLIYFFYTQMHISANEVILYRSEPSAFPLLLPIIDQDKIGRHFICFCFLMNLYQHVPFWSVTHSLSLEIITGRRSQGKRQKLWKLENSWESCLNRTAKTLSKTLLVSLDNGISSRIHLHERQLFWTII